MQRRMSLIEEREKMSLKFPFKFKHVSSVNEYLADQDNNDADSVVVSWIDNAGQQLNPRRYILSDVEYFIDHKNWVIIEEPSPLVEISQNEYDNLIEEINLLQDLLAEANNRIVELETKPEFKPVKDMDYFDWMIAYRKGHTFKTRDGNTTFVIEMDDEGTNLPVRTDNGWYRLDGSFYSDWKEVPEDIIERIS